MAEKRWIRLNNTVTNGVQTLSIGEYVKYEPLGTDYMGSWQIIGVSETGEMLIVSKDIVSSIELAGNKGFSEGISILNEVCKSYGKGVGAVKARSIRWEDIKHIHEEIQPDISCMVYGENSDLQYWLSNCSIDSDEFHDAIFGFKVVSCGSVRKMALAKSDGLKFSNTLGVRAVVYLDADINFFQLSTGEYSYRKDD